MAMQRRFPVEFQVAFPAGAFLVGLVEAVTDFNAPQRADGSRPQQLDKDSGLPLWQFQIVDADAAAAKRERTASIKVAAPHQLARRSVVQLGGSCGARLVGSSIAIVGGEVADRAALEAAARRAGLSVGPRGSDTTRVAVLGGAGMFAGLAHAATARATYGDVVVGIDNPTYLGMAHAKVAKIETFGRTPATWDALVAVLLGTARTTAKLPLSIEGAGAGC